MFSLVEKRSFDPFQGVDRRMVIQGAVRCEVWRSPGKTGNSAAGRHRRTCSHATSCGGR